jgi:hypothetical protein
MNYHFERRKHRRLDLSLLVEGRRQKQGREIFERARTTDISMGGAYFKTSMWQGIKVDDVISVSVSIPRQFAHKFPFSRIVGKARVVRVDKVLSQEGTSSAQGIALEFAPDMVFLARAV